MKRIYYLHPRLAASLSVFLCILWETEVRQPANEWRQPSSDLLFFGQKRRQPLQGHEGEAAGLGARYPHANWISWWIGAIAVGIEIGTVPGTKGKNRVRGDVGPLIQ